MRPIQMPRRLPAPTRTGSVDRRHLTSTLLLVASAVAAIVASPVAALPSAESVAADYGRMLEARFGRDPIPIPAGGLTLERDTATLTFTSGSMRWAEPTSGGQITGLVFEGQGRFRMLIPDPVELRQLQRMAQDRRLELIDTTFESAVLRTSEPQVVEALRTQLLGEAQSAENGHAGYEPHPLAKARQNNWFVHRFADIGARVAAGLLIPEDEFLFVEMKTDRFGWLNYAFDGLDTEEISIRHWNEEHDGSESWVQLDRASDRLESGRPRSERRPMIDLQHVAVMADVTEANKKYSRLGRARFNPRQGKFTVDITFEALVDGPRALPLKLTPWAAVTEVTTDDGIALPFLRDHIGSRSSALDKMLYDNDLQVLLDRPLVQGEQRTLRFVYEQMTLNYMPGGSWYPAPESIFSDLHSGTFTITSDDRFNIFAMGEEVETSVDKGRKTTVWKVEKPVRMLTFAFSDQNTQVKSMEAEGLPKIVAFGPSHENQIFNVAADTVNSITYFNSVFGHAPKTPTLYVTGILGGHGQSFEGFIHMAESSMHFESKGLTEAFRAHEVAHQWWGHEVAWKSYRDQWLSEAFAEYAAMLFMQATMEDGQKMYDDMVIAYHGSLTGVSKPTTFGARVIERNDKERARIGPIGVGYRASTAGTAGGYFGATYQKGALVLHMLRTMLRNMSKSDQIFFDVLRRFLDEYAGDAASTQDFIEVLSTVAPADWQWFFDQWIDGTDIPTYTWRAESGTQDGKPVVHLTVKQENVDRGFRMPVPVKFEFGKKQSGQVVILVDEPEETFTIPVPQAPRKIELNPDHAVLAVVKKQ